MLYVLRQVHAKEENSWSSYPVFAHFHNLYRVKCAFIVTELGWMKTSSYIMTLTFWRLVFLDTKGLLKTIRQLIVFIALGAMNYYSTKAFADSQDSYFSLLTWSRSYVRIEKNES